MLGRNKNKKKGKDSDEEEEEIIELGETSGSQVAVIEPTTAELQARELENVPTIPDSEVSPAAYIFQNMED